MDNPFKPSASYRRATLLITAVAAFVGIGVFAYIDGVYSDPYIIASFGATAVLIYGAPKAPFSQPKNVFFGHLFSAVIGVTLVILAKYTGVYSDYLWVFAGLAVALAIVVMMLTGTVHPPGGATALTCVLSGFGSYTYVFRPIMLGIVVMMVIAYVALRLDQWCEKHGH